MPAAMNALDWPGRALTGWVGQVARVDHDTAVERLNLDGLAAVEQLDLGSDMAGAGRRGKAVGAASAAWGACGRRGRVLLLRGRVLLLRRRVLLRRRRVLLGRRNGAAAAAVRN